MRIGNSQKSLCNLCVSVPLWWKKKLILTPLRDLLRIWLLNYAQSSGKDGNLSMKAFRRPGNSLRSKGDGGVHLFSVVSPAHIWKIALREYKKTVSHVDWMCGVEKLASRVSQSMLRYLKRKCSFVRASTYLLKKSWQSSEMPARIIQADSL
jgi:hypothetical protein